MIMAIKLANRLIHSSPRTAIFGGARYRARIWLLHPARPYAEIGA